jgi:hypothetical protein
MICITRIPQVSVRPQPRLSRENGDESETKHRRKPVAINQRHAIRAVDAFEFAEAWENIERLARGLDDHAMSEFRELLRRYMQGELTMSEWRDIVHSIIEWRGVAAE